MAKIALRIVFLISLSLNLALLLPRRAPGAAPASAAPEMQLSAAQVQQLAAVRQKTAPRYAELSGRLAAAQAQLINLLKQPQVDGAAVERCLADITGLQQQTQRLTVDEILACKSLLSHRQCACMLDASARKMGLAVRDGMVGCPMNSKETK